MPLLVLSLSSAQKHILNLFYACEISEVLRTPFQQLAAELDVQFATQNSSVIIQKTIFRMQSKPLRS
jgi:hypothetical protein